MAWRKNVDATIQSSTSPLFKYTGIIEEKTDILLTSPIAINETTVNVSPGHGFVAGRSLVIWELSVFSQVEVINVATNVLTVAVPFANIFTTGATVIRGDMDLNKNGAATPFDVLFKMRNSIIPVDISAAILQFQHGANVGDDGKFAGIAALTNGMYLRKEGSSIVNYGNFKKNIDFKLSKFKVDYTEKAPAGGNATEVIIDIKESFGQEVRLNPRKNDLICGRVRDKIDADEGIDYFRMAIVGSYTEGE